MTTVMARLLFRPPCWPAGPRGDNGHMICVHCRGQHHEDCPGGTWCDCQHLPPAGPAQDAEQRGQDAEQAAGQATEPPVNWVRQG